jgi:hypothetical protein
MTPQPSNRPQNQIAMLQPASQRAFVDIANRPPHSLPCNQEPPRIIRIVPLPEDQEDPNNAVSPLVPSTSLTDVPGSQGQKICSGENIEKHQDDHMKAPSSPEPPDKSPDESQLASSPG